MNSFQPKTAIVRGLPRSFLDSLKEHEPQTPINLDLALKQNHEYTNLLKSLVDTVIEIPADESFPDCCFIEDTAIIVGGQAAINFLGAPSRQGEEKAVSEALIKLGLKLTAIKNPGRVDGGDVLFTGQQLIVGLSRRTNIEGAKQLAQIFSGIVPVVTVDVSDTLHLKSVLSMFDQDNILFGSCDASNSIRQQLEGKIGLSENYVVQILPDSISANVLSLCEKLVIQSGFPKSEEILRALAKKNNRQVYALEMSEFIKADGALTCCSLLI